MRTDNLNRDVSVSAGVQSSNFTIVANAKMFSILADKLYSDKPRAVIREISCNALDAHGMNGQTKPFLISMPNVMEPMLVIRDFGPGMNDHDVMHVYTSFGESTKDGDNDQIGGFGLGAKSPFAYSDAFTVTVYQGGVKRNYAAYRGPDGVPQMSPIDSTPTDEEDGVEVRVPIKQSDWYTFENTAEDLLQHFPEGSFTAFGLDIKQIEYAAKEDGYWVRKEKMPRPYVLMGPVAYPLDWNLVVGPDDARLPETIVMVFNVGDLDLLPSREGLSYDKVTISRLRARYDDIVARYAEGEFERVKAMMPVEQLFRIEQLKEAGTWKMITNRWPLITEKGEDGKTTTVQEAGFPGINDYIEIKGRPQLLEAERKSSRSETVEVTARRMGVDKETSVKLRAKEHLNTYAAYVFDDLGDLPDHKRRVNARVKQLRSDWGMSHGTLKVVFFDVREFYVGPDKPPRREVTGNWTSADELRDYLTSVGWEHVDENVFALSELDLPVPQGKTGRAAGAKTELRVLAVTAQNYHERSHWRGNCWVQKTEPVTSGVYVPMTSYELDGFDEKWFKFDWAYDLEVIGLSKKARDQIKRDGTGDDFERLDHYVQRKQKEALADPATLAELARSRGIAEMQKDEIVRTALKLSLVSNNLFPNITEAILAADAQEPEPEVKITLGRVLNFYRLQGIEPPKTRFKSAVVREIKKTWMRSPFFRLAVSTMRVHANNILRQSQADHAALAKVTLRVAYPEKED